MTIDFLSSSPLRVHLIGVAGSGMSGIAGLLLELGHRVSGSDKVDSLEVERLKKLGLEFQIGHAAERVRGCDAVVYSSAIKPGNPEHDEATRLGHPLLRRAEALAAILNRRRGIVVAGMHGKTTTSAMTAHVLRGGDLRPGHYVGAEIPVLGTNAAWDKEGEWFVAEGDESDGTIVLYRPEHSILLNIEEEHLDFYADLAAIEAVYRRLCEQTSGTVFYCADDAHAARLGRSLPRVVSFGTVEGADYRLRRYHAERFQSRFEVWRRGEKLGEATLNVPGLHNASNATGVVALATELGIPFERIAASLDTFRGARRRFEFLHRGEQFAVVDDYAHHPSELRATLATARGGHRGRIVAMFQPHRYSRTLKLRREFGTAFEDADMVLIADVYPASEAPIPGVDGAMLAAEMSTAGHPAAESQPSVARMAATVGPRLRAGDLVISLGAGNIHEAGRTLAVDLAQAEKFHEAAGGEAEVRVREPMARHTTLRVGGPARWWAEPRTVGAFAGLLRAAKSAGVPVLVMGRGSNLLVRDGGFPGLVIHPSGGAFAEIAVDPERREITAGAGVKFKQLAGAAAKAGIGGFEWMEGIPGEVGGGLRMNAGAMGAETFGQVTTITLLDAAGNLREAIPTDLEIAYRHVSTLRENYVVRATFQGRAADPAEIRRRMEESAQKRKKSQPVAASAGCIFKNPSKECPAGKLVDELGLKGRRVGGAMVSDIHGNFIVNDGTATAADVLALIAQIQAEARGKRGIELHPEVQMIGEEASS